MSQPVVELCLAIPAVDLGLGVQDRPLARRAFAARLPRAIAERRSKGNLTAHFAQLVAVSVDELRPFLLEGNLVSAGVLNRDAVASRLDPAQLIHAPRPAELLMAAAVEAWVRHWQRRLPDSLAAPRRQR
jgi:asparagine synthase (glutamine-hydrolysing)